MTAMYCNSACPGKHAFIKCRQRYHGKTDILHPDNNVTAPSSLSVSIESRVIYCWTGALFQADDQHGISFPSVLVKVYTPESGAGLRSDRVYYPLLSWFFMNQLFMDMNSILDI